MRDRAVSWREKRQGWICVAPYMVQLHGTWSEVGSQVALQHRGVMALGGSPYVREPLLPPFLPVSWHPSLPLAPGEGEKHIHEAWARRPRGIFAGCHRRHRGTMSSVSVKLGVCRTA